MYETGEIYVYADNTKTVFESALTVIHEATHARINRPNTKNQELECYKNEYRHKGIVLTKNVIDDIVAYIDENYDYLEWEWQHGKDITHAPTRTAEPVEKRGKSAVQEV